MIEKDAGLPRIHRLRIIHLFEADYNFFWNFSGDIGLFDMPFLWIYSTTHSTVLFLAALHWIPLC